MMSAQPTLFTPMITLVKREFIEHRLLFVYAPLLCVLMCTLWFAIALAQSDLPQADPALYTDRASRDGTVVFTVQMQVDGYNMGVRWSFVRNMINQFERLMRPALWASLALYYLMTLYQQRMDRSVLFWNSLPVRDSQTIASKLLAGLVLCHGLYLFGIAILELLMPAVVWVYSRVLGTDVWDSYLGTVLEDPFMRNVALYSLREVAMQMPFDILWTLPVYGWLLLVSAWSPRVPVMWALGPWLFLIAIELALRDKSAILDSGLAHAFPVDGIALSPGRDQSQLIPGALLGALFIYGAIRLNGPKGAGLGFEAVRALAGSMRRRPGV
jgi:hypothetical protein